MWEPYKVSAHFKHRANMMGITNIYVSV